MFVLYGVMSHKYQTFNENAEPVDRNVRHPNRMCVCVVADVSPSGMQTGYFSR
jgi:hypothetical protein